MLSSHWHSYGRPPHDQALRVGAPDERKGSREERRRAEIDLEAKAHRADEHLHQVSTQYPGAPVNLTDGDSYFIPLVHMVVTYAVFVRDVRHPVLLILLTSSRLLS